MATIEAGQAAPDLNLKLHDADGNEHDLAAALARGPVLLGLYKSSCQASKTMFPFLERLYQRYRDAGLGVYGVSQDSANVTRSFARRLELTFPILIEPDGYPLSNAFAITATPTVFLVQPDGTVAFTTMGFMKANVDELGAAVAAVLDRTPEPVVGDWDAAVPMFVPG